MDLVNRDDDIQAYLCIAAELLSLGLCVQNVMIRSTYMLLQNKGIDLSYN
jgi:hypothetical protein